MLTKEEALLTIANYFKPKYTGLKSYGPDANEIKELEEVWENWLRTLYPSYFSNAQGYLTEFSSYQKDFWKWAFEITKGYTPDPFVAIWPRSSGKSTSAELMCAMLAARKARRYCLYVGGTQERADDHVQNIAVMLESSQFSLYYPEASQRRLSKYGSVRGWRRNRLQTASGFTIDSMGMDSSARGAKIDEDRPDIIICDDIDDLSDTTKLIEQKVLTLTKKLLPAGSEDLAVLVIQNLIREDGLVAQIASNKAEFLTNAIISGPNPAIYDLQYKTTEKGTVLESGTPSWTGFNLQRAQAEVNKIGITSFRSEFQHEVDAGLTGLFKSIQFQHCTKTQVPDMVRTVIWCDPAVTNTDKSDSHGIECDGIDTNNHLFRLYSWEGRTSPKESITKAIVIGMQYHVEHVGIETDQGGLTWEDTYKAACDELTETSLLEFITENPGLAKEKYEEYKNSLRSKFPPFVSEKAGAHVGNKLHRAQQMLASYERGEITHVLGTHDILEKALRRFPDRKPYDLTDAAYWAWFDLLGTGPASYSVIEREVKKLGPPTRTNMFGRR